MNDPPVPLPPPLISPHFYPPFGRWHIHEGVDVGAANNRFTREVLQSVERICAEAGATFRVDTGSPNGHARIVIALNGKQRFTPLSASPRNKADAIRYKLSDVRRLIREMAA